MDWDKLGIPAGKIYMKPLDQSRGQNAELWVCIGAFEKDTQRYPGYDSRLAPAISQGAYNDVIDQLRGYMNANAMFKGSMLCSVCLICPLHCCYVNIRAGAMKDEMNRIVQAKASTYGVKMRMDGKSALNSRMVGGDPSQQGLDQDGHAFGKMVQQRHHHDPHHNPHHNPQGQPRPPPPPVWKPHWPPAGYFLVIEVPMSAEHYFPIWRRQVAVPNEPAPMKAPQQVEMDKPELSKCLRPGCGYQRHSNQWHGYCCFACKDLGFHGLVCEKRLYAAKCLRPGCDFKSYGISPHGYCCNACKDHGTHGPVCEKHGADLGRISQIFKDRQESGTEDWYLLNEVQTHEGMQELFSGFALSWLAFQRTQEGVRANCFKAKSAPDRFIFSLSFQDKPTWENSWAEFERSAISENESWKKSMALDLYQMRFQSRDQNQVQWAAVCGCLTFDFGRHLEPFGEGFVVVIDIVIPEHNEAEFLKDASEYVAKSKGADGVVHFAVLSSMLHPYHFKVVESYQSEAAWKKHRDLSLNAVLGTFTTCTYQPLAEGNETEGNEMEGNEMEGNEVEGNEVEGNRVAAHPMSLF